MDWAAFTVEKQQADPGSLLHLYRAALRLRRELPALGDGEIHWSESDPNTLIFTREPGFVFAANLRADPVPVPAGEVLLASDPLKDGLLPADTAVWIRALSGSDGAVQ